MANPPATHMARKASHGTQRGAAQPTSSTAGTTKASQPLTRASTTVAAITVIQ